MSVNTCQLHLFDAEMKSKYCKIVAKIWMFIYKFKQAGINLPLWNLLFFSPVVLGSFSSLARAGDSLSTPLHYAITFIVFFIIWVSLQFSVTIGILSMYIYLVLMGWLRRSLISSTGYLSNDPIILVSALVSILFFVRLVLTKKVPNYTELSRLILILLLTMFLEIFNPLQGGIIVGASGALFYIVPILWYFIGLSKGSNRILEKILGFTVFVGLIEAIIGYNQTRNGLSEVEKYWTMVAGGGSQMLAGSSVSRSFGTFLSFSEYVSSLIVSCSVSWAMFLRKKYIYSLPFAIVFISLFISSSRTGLITLLFAIVLTWALQGSTPKIWIPRLLLALVIGLWGIGSGLNAVKDINVDQRTSVLVNHEIDGLTDPFAKNASSHAHIRLITNGIIEGFRIPIGHGLGASTLAAKKFGSELSTESGISSENDYANMFYSLGALGGIFYIFICIKIWIVMIRYWNESRDVAVLALLVLMAGLQGQWLTGAHYAQTMFFWFAIGAMDGIIFRQKLAKQKLLLAEKLDGD